MKNKPIFKNSQHPRLKSDGEMALITEWQVEDSKNQRIIADASLENMENGYWPEGLLYYHTYLGTDGVSILHYSNWRHEQDHINFLEKGLPRRLDELFKQVQLKDREMLGKFRIYKTLTGDSKAVPGCIIIIQEDFESPEVTPQWIDTVVEALSSEEQLPEGYLSAYFHISLDGKSMLNYAEWTSEEAHQKAMDQSLKGTIGQAHLWDKVINFKGRLDNTSLKRYKFYKSLTLL